MKSFFLHFVFSIVGFSMNAQSLNIKESPDTRKKLEAPENKTPGVFNTSLADLDLYVGEYTIPGEAELVATKTHEFTVKGVAGYLLKFEIVDGKSVGIDLDVPEGMFKAVRKKP